MIAREKFCVNEFLNGLKKEIRSSNNILIVAIDIGKFSHTVCFMLSGGKILSRKFGIANSFGGFKKLMEKIRSYLRKYNCPSLLVGMEPSGNYWRPIHDYLSSEHKIVVVTVSPLAVNRNRETIDVSQDKTDPKDAYNIADLLIQGKFYLPIQRDKTISQLSRFMHIYYRLVTDRSRLRSRLREVVSLIFPELERYFKDILCKTTLLILRNCPLPSTIKDMGISGFRYLIKTENPRFSDRRIQEIFKLAETSIGITGEDEACLFEIDLLLNELEKIETYIAKVNEEINKIVKDREDYRLLLTIKGVGPVTSAAVISEIGNIANFKSGKQLIKLSGLDLYGKSSGKTIHTLRHITKRGRKLLRTIMYQAAIACVRLNPYLKSKYLELLNNQPHKKKIKPKALVAIACKLLRIIFRMLKEKKAFDETYDNKLRQMHLKKVS